MSDRNSYIILPFNFQRFRVDLILLVNMAGEYLFLPDAAFRKFAAGVLDRKSDLFLNLKARHFLAEAISEPAIDLLAVKYRTKKEFLSHFTSLHMFEMTQRCNQRCLYCQASTRDPNDRACDMNTETAKNAVDMVLMSPGKRLKIEFQGGEPLLNYEIVKFVIEYASKQALAKDKELEFVACTNLTMVTDDMLRYFADNNILISTSLDGPKEVHDSCRRYRNGAGTYEDLMKSLDRAKKHLPSSKISALMTTTRTSLEHPQEIVDEYLCNGFNSLFVRSLNPFGYARQAAELIGYTVSEFVSFYKKILDYLIAVNLRGHFFEESFTSLLLTRILTPFSTGFVDLQFPAGTGISGVMYGHDGNVYVSDEARMLANMGDPSFCLGNVNSHSYRDLFYGDKILKLIADSCAELIPGCSDCVFQGYCGTDPVRNYATQNDPVGHRPTNDMCLVNKEIFNHLFEIILRNDPNQTDVFWSWITGQSLSQIRIDDRC